jgi:hypothetical protein
MLKTALLVAASIGFVVIGVAVCSALLLTGHALAMALLQLIFGG